MRIIQREELDEQRRVWHTRLKLTDKPRESNYRPGLEVSKQEYIDDFGKVQTQVVPLPPDNNNTLMIALQEIPGVDQVDIMPYAVLIAKAPLYDWEADGISSRILALLTCFGLGITDKLTEETKA